MLSLGHDMANELMHDYMHKIKSARSVNTPKGQRHGTWEGTCWGYLKSVEGTRGSWGSGRRELGDRNDQDALFTCMKFSKTK